MTDPSPDCFVVVCIVTVNFCFTGVQFEATEVATEESEDTEVGGTKGSACNVV